MYAGLHVKFPLFLSDFNETWIFMTVFRKIAKYQISWKSIQWEPSSMWTGGWMDRHEANSHIYYVNDTLNPSIWKEHTTMKKSESHKITTPVHSNTSYRTTYIRLFTSTTKVYKKSIHRYETTTFSPEYRTVNSIHPYEKIDTDRLVCKNTRQCHQEITILMGSGKKKFHLVSMPLEREIHQFLISPTNEEHAL